MFLLFIYPQQQPNGFIKEKMAEFSEEIGHNAMNSEIKTLQVFIQIAHSFFLFFCLCLINSDAFQVETASLHCSSPPFSLYTF